jgi:hypothetical protein
MVDAAVGLVAAADRFGATAAELLQVALVFAVWPLLVVAVLLLTKALAVAAAAAAAVVVLGVSVFALEKAHAFTRVASPTGDDVGD